MKDEDDDGVTAALLIVGMAHEPPDVGSHAFSPADDDEEQSAAEHVMRLLDDVKLRLMLLLLPRKHEYQPPLPRLASAPASSSSLR